MILGFVNRKKRLKKHIIQAKKYKYEYAKEKS